MSCLIRTGPHHTGTIIHPGRDIIAPGGMIRGIAGGIIHGRIITDITAIITVVTGQPIGITTGTGRFAVIPVETGTSSELHSVLSSRIWWLCFQLLI